MDYPITLREVSTWRKGWLAAAEITRLAAVFRHDDLQFLNREFFGAGAPGQAEV
jgi:hypothetical protein